MSVKEEKKKKEGGKKEKNSTKTLGFILIYPLSASLGTKPCPAGTGAEGRRGTIERQSQGEGGNTSGRASGGNIFINFIMSFLNLLVCSLNLDPVR